jgi:hypothetical protein
MTDQPRTEDLHRVRIDLRWDAWRRIQQMAEEERREPAKQAALILERAAARWKPTEQVA